MHSVAGNKIRTRKTPNDVFYTPLSMAQKLIEMTDIKPNEKVLDPSKGLGVFYDNLPQCTKEWCEITEGKDFFQYNEPVDVIIGNPPFSIWTKWLEHTIKLNPHKIAYIFGAINLTPRRLKLLEDAGYRLTKLHIVDIKGWFSNTFLAVFDKVNPAVITYTPYVIKE